MPPRLSYALIMLLALLVFLLARHFVPKPRGLMALPWQKRCTLAAAAFIGGSLGAKLPFLLWGVFGESGWSLDGKTVTTGLVGAYLAVELAKVLMDVRVKTGDTFALPLALAMAIGRWGCFLNGCCYGVATDLPWGVWFEVEGPDGPRWLKCHPTQIYESLFHLTMGGVLLVLLLRGWLRHQHLKVYLIAYGVYRFLTEYIRPEPEVWLGLTFYQWVSLALIAGLSAQWAFDRRRDFPAWEQEPAQRPEVPSETVGRAPFP